MSIKKKFLVDIDLGNNQINNVAAPQVSGDVATYEWVTGLISAEEAARGASFSTVDGKIKDIISNLDITAVDSFTEVVTKINADITAEAGARLAADSAESAARIAADSAESAARIAADASESASRIAADSAITSAYTAADSAESVARIAGDDAEASARSLADTTLQGNINVEKGRVDAILLASDADKNSFAEIVTLINSVDTSNDETFAGYVLSNNAAVAAEIANRISDVNAEETRALAAEDLLSGRITSEAASRIADVNAEETRGLAAEAGLQGSIDTEAASRIAADSAESAARIAADAATLASANAYSDGIAQGLDVKQSVRVASTTFISSLSGLQTIDAVALVAGNRILVKNQTIANANGIYVVSEGVWTRSTDADTSAKVTAGLFTFIEEGAINSDQGWVLQSNQPIVLGTTSLSFVQFSSAGVVGATNGLTKTGNNIGLGGTLTGGTTSLLGVADPTLYLGTSGSKLLTLSANVSNHYVNASYISNVSTGSLSNTATGGFTNTSMGGHLNNSATVGNINLTALAGNLGHNSTSMTITTSNGTGAVYGSDYSAGFVDNSLVSKLFVTNQIAAEASARSLADTTLQGNINVEKGRVDAILLASDADKNSFAEIVTLINSVDTTNDEAFAGYVLLNNAAVAAEIARATADVDSEETRALAAEALLSGRITSEVADRIADVNAEETRALAAEGVLQGNIDTLNSAAIKTASNGLTEVDNNVKLGGALTANTDITGAFGLSFGPNGNDTISSLSVNTSGAISSWSYGGNISTTAQNAKIISRSQTGTENSSANFISSISDSGNIITTATSGDILNTASAAITDSSASRSITTSGGLGAVYSADYSETFVNNSLVSKLYVTNRIAAEALSLQSDIDAVTANVDAILLASAADKNSFAEIVTLINSVDATSDSAFAGYVLSNNDALALEVANRISDVNAEETRAIAAEGVLTSNLASAKTIIADRMNITPVVSSFTIGNGLTHSFVLEHSLGTTDVIIQVYNVATGQTVETSAIRVGLQTISIEFASAPALNSYKVVTMGIKAFAFSGL